MRKSFDIHGAAPAHSKIKLIGPDDRDIGETEADSGGRWIIRGVAFDGAGDHEVHAEARTPVGHLVCSETIECHVESPEKNKQQAEDRERALALYERTAQAFAAGSGIDHETIKEVCALAGLSVERFCDDVALIRMLNEQDAQIEARLRESPC